MENNLLSLLRKRRSIRKYKNKSENKLLYERIFYNSFGENIK